MAVKVDSRTQKRLKKLSNRYWRLNHLYYILNDKGQKVLFELNPVQYVLYFALWWLNVIPKSRQHGITTFIAIFMLDACLFNDNVRAGIIAHKLEDAKKIFRDKIKFAYDNLPSDLRKARIVVKDNESEILLNNNSSIYVATSMRSGTLQYLHISEYGWLCAHAPNKAKEVKTGAMETVHEGGMIFVEATAEGNYGDFYDMCKAAQKLKEQGKQLGRMDYKLHFFAWHEKIENQTDPAFVKITPEQNEYFDKIQKIYNKKLTMPQRAWYVQKKARLKQDIYKEHPSTIEEAFIASVEGAFYAEEMAQMREEGRICLVKHQKDRLVHTVCDIGLGSNFPWIFFQIVGLEIHIIDCFCLDDKEDPYKGMAFYRYMLDEKAKELGYIYGQHFCPFDINKGEIGTGKALKETAEQVGINFDVLELERSKLDGIERLKNTMPNIWIDADKCQPVISSWLSYHKEWSESLGRYLDHPHEDQSAHFADAGRYLSKSISNVKVGKKMSLEEYREMKKKYA